MTTSALPMSSPDVLEPRNLRTTFGCFPTGVIALCTRGPEGPVGMAISTFTSVSLAPALVSVCVQKGSRTWSQIRENGAVGVSILSADQEKICRALSSNVPDRFAQVAWSATKTGAVFVDESVAWLECVVHDELDGGDHIIALLRITGHGVASAAEPLVFHRSDFRGLMDMEAGQ
ncbi:flavin reductase family protein [Alloalcanivorax sp. C16-1]|uniref:flavin reductase family protein n=1 Tax=Alloalcanivorax sp. C16-1 TaxID=3390051 RepID=UPI0039710FD0